MNLSSKIFSLALVTTICFSTMVSLTANADARSDYLINMLETGASYRLRVQAANSLGKIRCADALLVIIKALEDENDLVIIAAAVALGQIGDIAAIPQLQAAEKKAKSKALKSQLAVTLRILKAFTPEGDDTRIKNAKPKFLIKVDAMGNSSDVKRPEIASYLNEVVVSRLKKEPGIIFQEKDLSETQVRVKLKKKNLKGYILSGSVIVLERANNQIIAKISLTVFSNPDYNLVMMPSGEAIVPLRTSEMSQEEEYKIQKSAIRSATDELIGKLFQILADR